LAVKTLCTNRDLPLHMPVAQGATDFTMDSSAPWRSIRCVGRKTGPRPSYAQGDVAWRAISHLVLNYLSLTDTDSYRGASALQEVLKLYADPDEPEAHRQIDGIRSIGSQAVMRRAPAPGPIAFARGLELAVTFDERAFAGMGSFLLGAVLERFFAKYVSINSFTETVVRGLNREIKRWPARMGQREIC
jgi:type VI secretion system protein ImpG